MLRRGSILVELTVSFVLLAAIGLTVFKGSIDLMAPRQWTIYQNISDAYITYEEAYAGRVSFEELTSDASPWPIYPAFSSSSVEMGKFPGGAPIMATVLRTRISLDTGVAASANPTETESWQLQCHLTYNVGDDEYVKSRTVVRSQ